MSNENSKLFHKHINFLIPKDIEDYEFPFKEVAPPRELFKQANKFIKLLYESNEEDNAKNLWELEGGHQRFIIIMLGIIADKIEDWWRYRKHALQILFYSIVKDVWKAIDKIDDAIEEKNKKIRDRERECAKDGWSAAKCGLEDLGNAVMDGLKKFGAGVMAGLKKLGEILSDPLGALACALGGLLPLDKILGMLGITSLIDSFINKLIKPVLKILDPILKPFKKFPVIQTINDILSTFNNIMKKNYAKIINFITNNTKQIKDKIKSTFEQITQNLTKIFDNIDLDSIYNKSGISTLLKKMGVTIGNMLLEVQTKIVLLSKKMTDIFTSILKIITTIFKNIWKLMSQGLNMIIGIFSIISNKMSQSINKLETVFKYIKLILNNFDELIYNIQKTLKKLIKMLWKIIKNIFSYFKNYDVIFPNIKQILKNSILSYIY